MKVTGAAADSFIRRPPDHIILVLIHGPDAGLVAERADAIADAVLGADANDPFRTTQIDADTLLKDPARLADEAAQLSLIGGRRVVRVKAAADSLAKIAAPVLSAPGEALIIIEAGELPAGSPLRKLVEPSSNGAVLGCYPDGPRELTGLIQAAARERQIRIDNEAIEFLQRNLGGDRLQTRQEIEKLLLYAGDRGTISLADAAALVGNSSDIALDEIVYDAFDGLAAAVEAGLERLFQQGDSPVAVLRAAQRHAQRLHLSVARVGNGEAPDAVLRSLYIFFKLENRFKAQLGRWRLDQIQRVLATLTQAEIDCKTTGFPDETICRCILSGLGQSLR